jgi:phosphatidate cytidylyltransferase
LFLAIAALAIGVCCLECYRLLERQGARPFRLAGMVGALGLVWSFSGREPQLAVELPLLLAVLLSAGFAMLSRGEPAEMLRTTWSTLYPVIFVALLLAYLVALRRMPGEDGEDLVMLLFLCVIFGDTGALYVGSWIGRRPLAPHLSPKKTREGALAGLVASVGAAVVAHLWFYQRLPLGHTLILGLVLGIAGMAGDLMESMIKRAVGAKDSSGLIPGHGGLLDRTDSLLFSAPILYYYYRVFLQGGGFAG